MHPYLSQALAAERRRELAAEAAAARLASRSTPSRSGIGVRSAERARTAWARLTRARCTVCCAPSAATC